MLVKANLKLERYLCVHVPAPLAPSSLMRYCIYLLTLHTSCADAVFDQYFTDIGLAIVNYTIIA